MRAWTGPALLCVLLALPAARVAAQPTAAGAHADGATEQGQTALDESFESRLREDWIAETRRRALRDTKFELQLRSYYLGRDKFDGSESEALAVGGSAGFKTGYFREAFAIGATGYTSQPLYAPADKDGTRLLKPGQQGFAVIGELYGEYLVADGIFASIGRRGYDTPYINRYDIRMVPNSFEAVTLQGVVGDAASQWRFGAGYFDAIKQIDADEFVSMAAAAGAPAGVGRGVYGAGANYRHGDLSLGAVGYHSDDIIDIVYAEAKYALPVGAQRRLLLAAQFTRQQAAGDRLLTGSDFHAVQSGLRAELKLGRAALTAGRTVAGGGADLRSPWSGHPGYSSSQVTDFNRAGESATLLRCAYSFASISGLSAYGLWVSGTDPVSPTEHAKDEYDLNLQWKPTGGGRDGLTLRLRYAHIDQHGGGDPTLDDLRLILTYDPPEY